jgi:hypothetical protein
MCSQPPLSDTCPRICMYKTGIQVLYLSCNSKIPKAWKTKSLFHDDASLLGSKPDLSDRRPACRCGPLDSEGFGGRSTPRASQQTLTGKKQGRLLYQVNIKYQSSSVLTFKMQLF